METFLEVVSAMTACKAFFQISLDPLNAKNVLLDISVVRTILIHVLHVKLANINLLWASLAVTHVTLVNIRDFQDQCCVRNVIEDISHPILA
jgi:hypothetical protein